MSYVLGLTWDELTQRYLATEMEVVAEKAGLWSYISQSGIANKILMTG